MTNNSLLPIGIFDSGLGGLTVLKTLRERFPHEDFIYLGDTARIPYGSKSPRTIARYLEQNISFLQNEKVKAIVVACNSASTQIHSIHCAIPLYNVIQPGARKACAESQNHVVGVMATKATIANNSYVTEIEKLNPAIKVYQQACPLLVPLVEEGWDDDPITNLIVYRYISPLLAMHIDTLILGCTHYPILINVIKKVVGSAVAIVDSASTVADQIEMDLQKGNLLAKHDGLPGKLKIQTTDVSENFLALANRIMAPFQVKNLELVDIHF